MFFQVRQNVTFLEHRQLSGVFHHLQEQAQLGHLHGLRVEVHAVDVVEQDPLLLVHAQAVGLVILRQQDLILQMLFGVVLSVPI